MEAAAGMWGPFGWTAVPLSLAVYTLVFPHVFGYTWDAISIVTLFVASTLIISAIIDEEALHAMLVPRSRTQKSWAFPLWMRLVNWVLGAATLIALCHISDIADMDAPLESKSKAIAFAFTGLTYLTVVFCISCAECRKARGQDGSVGFYFGAAVPPAVYALFLTYVALRLDPTMLPWILTTDACIALSLPIFHSVILEQLRETRQPSRSSHSTRHTSWSLSLPSITWPRVVYSTQLCMAWAWAPPRTVAVLLRVLPGRFLAASKDTIVLPREVTEAANVIFDGLVNASSPLLDTEIRFNVRELAEAAGGPEQFIGLITALSIILFLTAAAWCCGCFGPSRAAREEAARTAKETAATARRRLTKLRASSKLFPPPYPNGWYYICAEEDIPDGKAIPASACNKEFVVFRGEDGNVAVLDAFCPHLGTHLGHGGRVKGNAVVCPYHEWTFDAKGKCIDIPYCPKAPNDRTHTKAFHSQVRLGMVFVWLHAEGEEPTYDITIYDDIEKEDMRYVTDVPCPNWQMHIMEPSQNAADPYHFNTVHTWLGAKDMFGTGGFVWARHDCSSRLAVMGHKEPDGSPIPETVIHIDEKVTEMWLFGIIPIPKWYTKQFSSGATFQGPQLSVFRINTKVFGSCRLVFTFTPDAPFDIRTRVKVYATPNFPRFLASIFGKFGVATVNQDRPVWENKLAVAPRNVVAGDGPFAAYGTWLRQFYSENSEAWGSSTLDW